MSDYLSLCLLSYNRLSSLQRTLDSLRENTKGPYELLVNDDCSDPVVTEYLIKEYQNRYISTLILNNGNNQGVGKSIRNMFEIASGKYIVKIDQDLTFSPNWDVMARNVMETFPEIGCLGLFKYFTDPVDHEKMYINTLHSNMQIQPPVSVNVVKDFVGSAFVVSKELYDKVGIGIWSDAFAEDVVFKKKIQEIGLKLGLTTIDVAKNWGFGPPNSTVVYQEPDGVKVTKITKEPLIFNKR